VIWLIKFEIEVSYLLILPFPPPIKLTTFLLIHVVEQMWAVPVVQSTKIHSTIWYWECHDHCTLKITFVDFEIVVHYSCYTMIFCYRPINLITPICILCERFRVLEAYACFL
jgi:hypothetical protein